MENTASSSVFFLNSLCHMLSFSLGGSLDNSCKKKKKKSGLSLKIPELAARCELSQAMILLQGCTSEKTQGALQIRGLETLGPPASDAPPSRSQGPWPHAGGEAQTCKAWAHLLYNLCLLTSGFEKFTCVESFHISV